MSKDYERLPESAEAFIYMADASLDGAEIDPLVRLFGRFLYILD